MDLEQTILTSILFFVIAVLYSSVGHAGSSGYLAIISFMSFSAPLIKPTSLSLNIIVSIIATYKYLREKCFNWSIFWPFATSSIPMSFLGGFLHLNDKTFKIIAGIFLIISSILLITRGFIKNNSKELRKMPLILAVLIGAVIGFLSGIIGVGGGIFLSPIIILLYWCKEREASGVAALFILVNSITALMGQLSAIKQIPVELIYWIPVVIVGGILGSHLGTTIINKKGILILLSIVLFSAGIKMLNVLF